MEEQPEHRQPSNNGNAGYEVTDSAAGPIYRFGVGLVVLIAAALFASAVAFSLLTEREARQDEGASPVAVSDESPPEPRLQPIPARDLSRLRAIEEETLSNYGWVDQERDLLRIPIDKAIELVAEGVRPRAGAPEEAEPPAESP